MLRVVRDSRRLVRKTNWADEATQHTRGGVNADWRRERALHGDHSVPIKVVGVARSRAARADSFAEAALGASRQRPKDALRVGRIINLEEQDGNRSRSRSTARRPRGLVSLRVGQNTERKDVVDQAGIAETRQRKGQFRRRGADPGRRGEGSVGVG